MIDPAFFGEQGIIISAVAIFGAFTMLGDEPAIIKRIDDEIAYARVVLFTRCLILAMLFIVLCGLYWQNYLPGESKNHLFIVLVFLVQSMVQITNIYGAFFTKRMLFSRAATVSTSASLVSVSVACVLAFNGHKLSALLVYFILDQLVQAVLTVSFAPVVFLPKYDGRLFKEFIGYAKNVFFSGAIDRVYSKAIDVFLGTYVGKSEFGFFQRAQGVGGILQTMMSGGIIAYTQPLFAKMQTNREKLGRNFELTASILMRVSIPVFLLIAFILPTLIDWVYGPKWLPAVPVFRLLLPFLFIQSFRTLLRWTKIVAGSPRHLAYAQVVEVGVMALITYNLLDWDPLRGVVVGLDISAIIGVAFMLFYFRKYAEFSIPVIFVSPLSAGAFAGAGLLFKALLFPGFSIGFLNIAVSIMVFAVIYMGSLVWLDKIFAIDALTVMRNRFKVT